MMRAELEEQERDLLEADRLPTNSADYHLHRIRRLARAWRASQRAVALKGVIGADGSEFAEPNT
eukprot:4770310-Pyramimonas_sp.AAC.1